MLNKVTLIGNLGADPEVRYMPNGGAVTNISLATTRRWKDKQTGERRDETEWHRVVFFTRLAEVAGEYLRKGSQVYIEGRIRTRKWQGQDGQDRKTEQADDWFHHDLPPGHLHTPLARYSACGRSLSRWRASIQ